MITPAQSRSARAMLDWSREQLAEKSEVALRTIVDFERGAREPRKVTLIALKNALEQATIEFINTPEREGVARKIAPIRAETELTTERPAYITQPGHRRVNLDD